MTDSVGQSPPESCSPSPTRTGNGEVISLPSSCSKEELELLARLEEQNKMLESDSKSLNSLASTHSRKSSDTSQVSITSGTSQQSALQDDEGEDIWVVWGRVVNEWDTYAKKKNGYVKDLVRKGIPQHFRGLAWQLLCNAHTCAARDQYADYMKTTSPCEKVIRRDIARTYPEHEFFREKDGAGQEGLFNVMKAYSLHDREVGYCQGSAFIVGLLLLQMPEEEAFAVLVRLMQDYRLREMYKPSMAELGLCMYQLECIVQELIPELHIHFQSQSFHTSMYGSSWFLTLFTSSLSLHLASRVMDIFLSEGMEIVFRIAVAILQFCKEDLLQMDMESMLRYFQKEMPSKCETDPDYLINLALQVKYNSKKMKKLEKDYTTLKVKEQEELVELRRLRTENRLLRQRIENLEQESCALADRLIQGQVSRAQEAEVNFVIKRELAVVKHQEQETHKELELAYQKIEELHEVTSRPPSLDAETEALIRSLQDELVVVKLREAERLEVVEELKQRMQELEETNKHLREQTPDNCVAHLQEELIAVKLREAEANLSMKELRQKVSDLKASWENHLEELKAEPPSMTKKQEKTAVNRLQEEVMTMRIHEAEALAELKDMRQKVMELETQVQVSMNQIRRQADETKRLQEKNEDLEQRERDLQNQLKDENRKYGDLESKMKAELVMARIQEAEHMQKLAELQHKASSLEIKNQEFLTVRQIRIGSDSEEVKDLQDRMAEVQAEVMRLEIMNKKLTSAMAMQNLRKDSTGSRSSISEGSLSRISSVLDGLVMSRSNSLCDDNLAERLQQLGLDVTSQPSKELLLKNNMANGEK